MNILKKIIPTSFVLFYHKLKAIFADWYFGSPSKKLTVIGITGTNGKTTTCNLIAKILMEDGHKVGMATTINFRIGKKEWVNETKMTTLSAWQLQSLLARMVKIKCQYAIIETSSHALVQHRVWGINYDVIGITNVTREHLDYHKSMDEYANAKLILFKNLLKNFKKKGIKKTSVINLQDKYWKRFLQEPTQKQYAYSLTKQSTIKLAKCPKCIFIHAEKIKLNPDHSTFEIVTPGYRKKTTLYLPGEFNIQNALLATCIARSQKIKLSTISRALGKVKLIPGRLQKIETNQKYSIYIDYAVTPDSLEKLYRDFIKPISKGRIIAVFGSCGDRDRGKRPQMGSIIGTYADISIITHEDSWTEDPAQIRQDIAQGFQEIGKKEGQDYFIIPDRRDAIAKAIRIAKPNDIIVITGKGAETKMVYPDKVIHWNEREVVEELLKNNK